MGKIQRTITHPTGGFIKCEGCGKEDLKYQIKLLEKTEYCESCGSPEMKAFIIFVRVSA